MLVIGSLLVAGVLSEVVLWAIGYSYPSFARLDPHTGFALRPYAEGWWNEEGKAYIEINSHGQRDHDHSLDKSPNTLRVAVLGDSFSAALQVPIEQTFWSVAERRLNHQCSAIGRRRAEFLNFGVPGYGTAQELQTLRYRVWPFDPDIVVLAFLTGNDIRNNSRALEGITITRPYFELTNGKLVLDDSFRNNAYFQFRVGWFGRRLYNTVKHSRVFQLANEVRHRLRVRAMEAQQKQIAEKQREKAGVSDSIYRAPVTDAWRDAWAVTDALIRLMAKEVQERDARFVVMTLSNAEQVDPDRDKRSLMFKQEGADDPLYPDRRVISVAAKTGSATLMTVPTLQKWAEAKGECVHGFDNASVCGGHWNENGHRIAGELLAATICADLSERRLY